MNLDRLARHYPALTARERLSLVLAAAARGDEDERSRLLRAAPRLRYEVQEHFGHALAFYNLSLAHLLALLDLAARYYLFLGAAASGKGGPAGEAREAAFLHGHLILVNLAGWRLFCEGEQLDPEVLWSRLPGVETVRQAEGLAREASLTPEEARRTRWGPDAAPTAEEVASDLREGWRAGLEWWA